MGKYYLKFLLLLLFFIGIVMMPKASHAASFQIEASSPGPYNRGDDVQFTISIDTTGQVVKNAVAGVTYETQYLQYVSVTKGVTMDTVTAQDASGTISITGTNNSGFTGNGTFATLSFNIIADAPGSTTLCTLTTTNITPAEGVTITPAIITTTPGALQPLPTTLPSSGYGTETTQQMGFIGLLLLFISIAGLMIKKVNAVRIVVATSMLFILFSSLSPSVLAFDQPFNIQLTPIPCNRIDPTLSCPKDLLQYYYDHNAACASSLDEFKSDPIKFHYWVEDPQITEQGKADERARQFIYWVLNTSAIDSHPTIRTVWYTSSLVALFFVIIVAAIFGIGYIVSQKTNYQFPVEFKPSVFKIFGMILYIVLSYAILLFLIQLSEMLMSFFINNLGGKELFNIYFSGSTSSEQSYTNFVGCRDLNIRVQEGANAEIFLLKLTNVTYYVMGVMILIRKILLWFLIFVSPFLAILLPFILIRNTGLIWIGVFFQWLFYGPLLALFLGALAKIWSTGIPFNFDFSRVDNQTIGYIYPTAIIITYGGPAQINNRALSAFNNGNYVDTFAEYVIALLMLWAVTFFPWWLLRIFRDYCCEGIYASRNILLAMYDQMRAGPPPKPGGGPTAPAPTFKTRIDLPKDTGIKINVQLANMEEIKQTNTSEIARALNLSVRNIADVARLETNKQTQQTVKQNLNLLSNPIKASTPAQRQQFMNLRTELFSRAVKNDTTARTLLAATSTSKVEQIRQKQEMIKTLHEAPTFIQIVADQIKITTEKVSSVTEEYVNSLIKQKPAINNISIVTHVPEVKVQNVLQAYVRNLNQTLPTIVEKIATETNTSQEQVKAVLQAAKTYLSQSALIGQAATKEKIDKASVQKIMTSIAEVVREKETIEEAKQPIVKVISFRSTVPEEKAKNIASQVMTAISRNEELIHQISSQTSLKDAQVKTVLTTYTQNLSQPSEVIIERVAQASGIAKEKVGGVMGAMAYTALNSKNIIEDVARKENLQEKKVEEVIGAQMPVITAQESNIEKTISIPASISLEDYEEVKDMWTAQYEEGEVPVTENIKTRGEWVDKDIVLITNTLNKLLSSDEKIRQEGLDDLGYILPVFMINNMKGEEILVYLKAKLEGAKAVQKQIERDTVWQEKIKSQKATEEEYVEVSTSPTITQEKEMTVEEEVPETSTTNVKVNVHYAPSSPYQQLAASLKLQASSLRDIVRMEVNRETKEVVKESLENILVQTSEVRREILSSLPKIIIKSPSLSAIASSQTNLPPEKISSVTSSFMQTVANQSSVINTVSQLTSLPTQTIQSIFNSYSQNASQPLVSLIQTIASHTNSTPQQVQSVLSYASLLSANSSALTAVSESTQTEKNIVQNVLKTLASTSRPQQSVLQLIATQTNLPPEKIQPVVDSIITAVSDNHQLLNEAEEKTNLSSQQIQNLLQTYTQSLTSSPADAIKNTASKLQISEKKVGQVMQLVLSQIQTSSLLKKLASEEQLETTTLERMINQTANLIQTSATASTPLSQLSEISKLSETKIKKVLQSVIQTVLTNSDIMQEVAAQSGQPEEKINKVLTIYGQNSDQSTTEILKNIQEQSATAPQETNKILATTFKSVANSQDTIKKTSQETNLSKKTLATIIAAVPQTVQEKYLSRQIAVLEKLPEEKIQAINSYLINNTANNSTLINDIAQNTQTATKQVQSILNSYTQNSALPIDRLIQAISTQTQSSEKTAANVLSSAFSLVKYSSIVKQTAQKIELTPQDTQRVIETIIDSTPVGLTITPLAILAQSAERNTEETASLIKSIFTLVQNNTQVMEKISQKSQTTSANVQKILNSYSQYLNEPQEEMIQHLHETTGVAGPQIQQVLKNLGDTIVNSPTITDQIVTISHLDKTKVTELTNNISTILSQPTDETKIPVTNLISFKANVSLPQAQTVTSAVMTAMGHDKTIMANIATQTGVQPEQVKTVLTTYTQNLSQPSEVIIERVAQASGIAKEKVGGVMGAMAYTALNSKNIIEDVARKENLQEKKVEEVIGAQMPVITAQESNIEKTISIPASISLEDYEEVKDMWTAQYEEGEVPVTENIKTRGEWVDKDIVLITNTLNKLLSSDEKIRQEGLDDLGYILPVFMINNMKGEEILVYLKAKLEGAKAVQKQIERDTVWQEKIKSQKATEEEYVEVSTSPTITQEKEMTVEEEVPETSTTNVKVNVHYAPSSPYQQLAASLKLQASSLRDIVRMEVNRETKEVVKENLQNILSQTSTVRSAIIQSIPQLSVKSPPLSALVSSQTNLSTDKVNSVTSSFMKAISSSSSILSTVSSLTNLPSSTVQNIFNSYVQNLSQPITSIVPSVASQTKTTLPQVKSVLTYANWFANAPLITNIATQEQTTTDAVQKIIHAVTTTFVGNTNNPPLSDIIKSISIPEKKLDTALTQVLPTMADNPTITAAVSKQTNLPVPKIQQILNTYSLNLQQPAIFAQNKAASVCGLTTEKVQQVITSLSNQLSSSPSLSSSIAQSVSSSLMEISPTDLNNIMNVFTTTLSTSPDQKPEINNQPLIKVMGEQLTIPDAKIQPVIRSIFTTLAKQTPVIDSVVQKTKVPTQQIQQILTLYSDHADLPTEQVVKNISQSTGIDEEQIKNTIYVASDTLTNSPSLMSSVADAVNTKYLDQAWQMLKLDNQLIKNVQTESGLTQEQVKTIMNVYQPKSTDSSEKVIEKIVTQTGIPAQNVSRSVNYLSSTIDSVTQSSPVSSSQVKKLAQVVKQTVSQSPDLNKQSLLSAVKPTITFSDKQLNAIVSSSLTSFSSHSQLLSAVAKQTNLPANTIEQILSASMQNLNVSPSVILNNLASSANTSPQKIQAVFTSLSNQLSSSPSLSSEISQSINTSAKQTLMKSLLADRQYLNSLQQETGLDRLLLEKAVATYFTNLSQDTASVIKSLVLNTGLTPEVATQLVSRISQSVSSSLMEISPTDLNNIMNVFTTTLSTSPDQKPEINNQPLIKVMGEQLTIPETKIKSITTRLLTTISQSPQFIQQVSKQTNLNQQQITNLLTSYTQNLSQPTDTIMERLYQSSGIPKEQIGNTLKVISNTFNTSKDIIAEVAQQEGVKEEDVSKTLAKQLPLALDPSGNIEQTIAIPATISIDDYEEIKAMWIKQYESGEVPLSVTIRNRREWIESDIVFITNTLNKLLSSDLKLRQQGLDELGYILPIFLINDLKAEELLVYLKAKLEAAKYVKNELELQEEMENQLEKDQENEEFVESKKTEKEEEKAIAVEDESLTDPLTMVKKKLEDKT